MVAANVVSTLRGLLASHRHRSQAGAAAGCILTLSTAHTRQSKQMQLTKHIDVGNAVGNAVNTLQVCGLRELAQLALVGDAIASQLLTPEILSALLVCLSPSFRRCPRFQSVTAGAAAEQLHVPPDEASFVCLQAGGGAGGCARRAGPGAGGAREPGLLRSQQATPATHQYN